MTSKQLKDTPLPELKRIALEDLKITKDQVREYGHLSYRQTWMDAIASIRDGIKQLTISDALASANQAPDIPKPENVKKNHITSNSHIAIELGWASPLAEPYLTDDIFEIIVNPAILIKLSQTHKDFKDWQPWMDIGRQFTFGVGSIYTILYFDAWGFCLALQEDSSRPATLSLATISACCNPILKKNLQLKTATSNELEVAVLKNGLLHQGSKNGVFASLDVANTEVVLPDDCLIIGGDKSQPTEPEIIKITPEEYPETWELLQPSESEEKQENYTINLATYEVIQSSPEPDLYTFESSPESPSTTVPKLPFEDFFRALFLGLPVLVPNQSA